MGIGRKLALLLTLSCAGSAVASASAYADDYVGSGWMTFASGGVTITCTTSSVTLTTTGTIDWIGADDCDEDMSLSECSFSADTLPVDFRVGFGTPTPQWTVTSATEALTITCGDEVIHCDLSADSTLGGTFGTVHSGGTFTIDDAWLAADLTSLSCGSSVVWNASWTLSALT